MKIKCGRTWTRSHPFIAVGVLLASLSGPVAAEYFGGVDFPDGERSFADRVVKYANTGGVGAPYDDATRTLGPPDVNFASLGNEGSIILHFVDNSLTTSGTSDPDLWVFEVGGSGGGVNEPTSVFISKDGQQWIYVGATSGSTAGIDLDAFVGAEVELGALYSYVRLVDLLPAESSSPTAGADIDAVGAISSGPPVHDTGEYVDLTYVADINDNGAPEIAVLRIQQGRPVVLIRDSLTGAKLSVMRFLSPNFRPKAVSVVPDTNDNGFSELAVLGVNIDNGTIRTQIRDSATGALLKDLNYAK